MSLNDPLGALSSTLTTTTTHLSDISLSTMAESKLEIAEAETSLVSSEPQKPAPVPAVPASRFERLVQPCLAELLGTTFFVFIGCVSVIENVENVGRLQPALVHGLAVAVLVACMAEISGAHFNPPFTLAIYLCGGLSLNMVVPYLVSQVVGGVVGASMAKMMTSSENYAKAQGAVFNLLQSDDQLGRALFGEVAMTCLIAMVVLMGAVNPKSKSPLVPFMVGCTVIVNVLAGGDVSGTCLNPARAFGPALLTNYWTYHWVYWAGPTGGSLIAAALVRLFLGDRQTRVILK